MSSLPSSARCVACLESSTASLVRISAGLHTQKRGLFKDCMDTCGSYIMVTLWPNCSLLSLLCVLPPGYRCFKAVMFLSGLMFGSVIIFLLCHKEHVLDTQLSVEASAGIGIGIGLLCGLVTMLVRSVGLFMTGLLLGLLLALAALLVTQQFYTPTTVWVPLGALLGSGMLFAVLTLQWQKMFTMVSTAVFGAAIMTVCADYFVEMLALATHVYECLRLTPGPPLCWYSWVILGIWPALSLLGVLVQWKLTDNSFSHTEGKLDAFTGHMILSKLRERGTKASCESGEQGTLSQWLLKGSFGRRFK